jgi:hypothetical protein
MSRAKKVLANIGKFAVFSLLMGIGSLLLSAIMTDMIIIHNLTWILGKPTEGSTYAAITQVICYALWGFVGPLFGDWRISNALQAITAALDGDHIHRGGRIWLDGVCTSHFARRWRGRVARH